MVLEDDFFYVDDFSVRVYRLENSLISKVPEPDLVAEQVSEGVPQERAYLLVKAAQTLLRLRMLADTERPPPTDALPSEAPTAPGI